LTRGGHSKPHFCVYGLQILIIELQAHSSRAHRRLSQHLLQPPDIDPVPDNVDGKACLKLCGCTCAPITAPYRFTSSRAHCWDREKGRIARDGVFSHVTQLSQRYHVKLEPPLLAALRLHDIDHVIVVFDVLGPQVQQFIDADS
jgi:hypothetical protein